MSGGFSMPVDRGGELDRGEDLGAARRGLRFDGQPCIIELAEERNRDG